MNINIEELNEEQLEFVNNYQKIHDRLSALQDQMQLMQIETEELIKALQDLRKKENKIFNNGEK